MYTASVVFKSENKNKDVFRQRLEELVRDSTEAISRDINPVGKKME